MKRLQSLLVWCLTVSLLLAACQSAPADGAKAAEPDVPSAAEPEPPAPPPAEPALSGDSMAADAIQPLSARRWLVRPQGADGVEPYGAYYGRGGSTVPGDLSGNPALAYSLTFSDTTTFPEDLPAGYNPEDLLEWGKAPGLNVDLLHKHGFTGEGSVIAYVDQPVGDHEQYNGPKLHYTSYAARDASMHGAAVLSLLAGRDIGTAPDAEIHYFAYAAPDENKENRAECLYQIIERNKTLPEGEKITMVGFSNSLDPRKEAEPAFRKAVADCEEAGVMVWFCDEYAPASFLPFSDKNDCGSLVADQWWNGSSASLFYVPSSGRTTAAVEGDGRYIYWSTGGLSWTMPYMLGLYAIAAEIDPSLNQDQLRQLAKDTARSRNGLECVDPVGFISAVLDGAGRGEEANQLRREAAERERYVYAVLNRGAMSREDLTAVENYLAAMTDVSVLVVDAGAFSGAGALYAALRADAARRSGTVAGVQIFGTPDEVPAFLAGGTVRMADGDVSDCGEFLTDLFYGNFENDPARISSGYSIMDHFEEGWDVELVPRWPVARLPLEEGQYADFFGRYRAFVEDTGLRQLDFVSFSSPIFPNEEHIDDMGRFLERADGEFHLLDVPYRLYGTLEGDYPVTTGVQGGFSLEELARENEAGAAELVINGHGALSSGVDYCVFVDGEQERCAFLTSENVGTVLDGNSYYLDAWSCETGAGMADNFITAALTGRCMGAFAATAELSNNGIDCEAGLDDLPKGNPFYFFYQYLSALREGYGRSAAFFSAQRAYGQVLLADSAGGLRVEGNYQFNLRNLLAYHNFGVLEPGLCWTCIGGM